MMNANQVDLTLLAETESEYVLLGLSHPIYCRHIYCVQWQVFHQAPEPE